jgi:hypothetical protein
MSPYLDREKAITFLFEVEGEFVSLSRISTVAIKRLLSQVDDIANATMVKSTIIL